MTDADSMDDYAHETARYELFRKCEEFAEAPNGGSYAIAFVLFDIVKQLVDLRGRLDNACDALERIATSADHLAEQMDSE